MLKHLMGLGLVLALFSSTRALASPAHYVVVEWTDAGLEVVHQRVVDMRAVPPTRTREEVDALMVSPPRHVERMAGRLISPDGELVWEGVTEAQRWMHAETHHGVPQVIRIERPSFVVRAPYVGGGVMHLQVALGGPSVTVPLHVEPLVAPAGTSVPPPSNPAVNRVDILIMGDGYTQAQQSSFEAKAAEIESNFFSVSPYSDYRSFVTVSHLFTASSQSGADHPTYNPSCVAGNTNCCGDPEMQNDPLEGTFVNTAFDSTFCYYNIHRLMFIDASAVLSAAGAAPDWDQILLVVNDTTYGGAGGFPSVMSAHELAVQIAQHEYGHTFTGLADEYDYAYPGFPNCSDVNFLQCEPNVTDVTSRADLKWASWVQASTPLPTPETGTYQNVVGAFEGARYQTDNMYRPMQACAMLNLGDEFCPVCTQAYILKLYQGGWGVPNNGIDIIEPGTESPAPGTIQVTGGGNVPTLTVELLEPSTPTLEVVWKVDGQVVPGANGPSFTPDVNGSAQVVVEVTDTTPMVHPDMAGSLLRSTRTWNLQFANSPPVLATPPARSAAVGDTVTVAMDVTDPDDDTITCSSPNLPSGASLNSSTCLFTWTVPGGSSGTYNITIIANDGTTTDSATLSITVVSGNLPPDITAPATVPAAEGAPVSFDVTATDDGGANIAWTVTGRPNGSAFNTNTGEFSWTPGHDDAGSHIVHFAASDGTTTAIADVLILVSNTNRAPVLATVAGQQVTELSQLTVDLSATDPDGDSLSYSVSPLPSGANMNPSSGRFTWTPDLSSAGTRTLTFTVDDGTDTDSQDVTITVINLNQPPTITAVPDQSVNEGEQVSFSVSASDPDGDPITFSSNTLPEFATLDANLGQFSWIPTFLQAGDYNVFVRASDGQGNSEVEVSIHVENVNGSPVIAPIQDFTMAEGQELVVQLSVVEPDGESLELSMVAPQGMLLDVVGQTLRWTPSYSQAGNHTVTLNATDGTRASSRQFNITVTDVNQPPQFQNPDTVQAVEGEELTVSFQVVDQEGDAFTLEAINIPQGASFSALQFTWTPGFSDAGDHFALFRASDGTGSTDHSLHIIVDNRNRPPVFDDVPDQETTVGEEVVFTVSARDEDGQALTVSAESLPNGANFSAQDLRLNWTPSDGQEGEHSLVFQSSDGEGVGELRVRVQVNPRGLIPGCACEISQETSNGNAGVWFLGLLLVASRSARKRRA